MMHLRTARVAMVALTALGMIWASTAQAAGHEASVYSHYPQHLDNPTTPIPGQTGSTIGDTRGDVKVTIPSYNQYYAKMLTTTWTIRVDSIGNYPAKDVKMNILQARINPVNGHEREYEESWVTIGDMAPGAVKTTTVTCQEKAGHLPCAYIRAAVYAGPNNEWDRDTTNNWKSRALFDVVFPPK